MRIYYSKTQKEAAEKCANVIAELLKKKKDAVLGFATGSSPVMMYRELINKCEAGEISFEGVKTVNLDEYVGLSADHDQSFSYFMHDNLFNHINIKEENTNLPDGLATDLEAERRRYDGVIESMGGIDIQVLGIGHNGHIGFNEPADSFSKGTALVDLTKSTIDANSRFFESPDDVPRRALTMGIGQIMQAKKIVMVANGTAKAAILEDAFFGEVSPKNPASILQFFKGEVDVFLDEEALSLIMERHPEAVIK
ncbi:MAG: glucosamine-6-phosphate deaminase [Clostridia bacterium]|nr:glucosamine-6-phosphate deaminase [Clostridia bacterium]